MRHYTFQLTAVGLFGVIAIVAFAVSGNAVGMAIGAVMLAIGIFGYVAGRGGD